MNRNNKTGMVSVDGINLPKELAEKYNQFSDAKKEMFLSRYLEYSNPPYSHVYRNNKLVSAEILNKTNKPSKKLSRYKPKSKN